MGEVGSGATTGSAPAAASAPDADAPAVEEATLADEMPPKTAELEAGRDGLALPEDRDPAEFTRSVVGATFRAPALDEAASTTIAAAGLAVATGMDERLEANATPAAGAIAA